MPAARVFTPKNRLAGILGDASDPTREALAARAERNLEAIKPRTQTYLRGRLKQIEALAALEEDALAVRREVMAALALEVCETGAAADMVMVGEAARALYILLTASAPWHGEAVRLHCRTLALLASTDLPGAEIESLLGRLRTVRRHVGVAD